jgi:exodeoxyribonuclease VII large subunit
MTGFREHGRRNGISARRPTPAVLGRDPASAIPVELAINGLARAFRKRFPGALWLTGELVQVRAARGGRFFAVLRDGSCRADVHLPPGLADQGEMPSPGTMVLVKGRLRIREQAGALRIEAETPLLATPRAGERDEARKAAKRELRAAGLFNKTKRALPAWPAEVAVISSAHGAVIEDVRAVISRRAPWVRVRLYDCAVQGPTAPASVIEALGTANGSAADLIIVARGGGAADDFDAFDHPQVVRAVAASRLPVIVAVGHQPDCTLSDLAADASAGTPSAAAERAVPDGRELRAVLNRAMERIHTAAWHRLVATRTDLIAKKQRGERAAQGTLALTRERLEQRNPERLLGGVRRLLRTGRGTQRHTRDRVGAALRRQLESQRRRAAELAPVVLARKLAALVRDDRQRAAGLVRTVRALSPERLLARGYAIPLWSRAPGGDRESLQVGSRFRLLLDDVVVAVVAEDVTQRPTKGDRDDRTR